MKRTLLFALMLALATACEKSNMQPDDTTSLQSENSSITNEKNGLVGKWRLAEYFQDRGDGTGQWITATEQEEITFTANGEVIISGSNSPLAGKGYNRYRIVDGNRVELSSTSNSNKEEYYYNREASNDLIFNPQCRENCSRRYKMVG